MRGVLLYIVFFFFNDTATTEIYTLSLHDALPIYRLRELRDDLARGHVEGFDGCVQVVNVAAAALPLLDPAGIDALDRVALAGPEQPGDEGPQLLRLLRRDLTHDIMVVAEEQVEPLLDDRRLVQLL